MAQYKVITQQTWFDIALLTTGSADAAYDLAQRNNALVTDSFTTNQLNDGIELLDEVINRSVQKYLLSQDVAATEDVIQ